MSEVTHGPGETAVRRHGTAGRPAPFVTQLRTRGDAVDLADGAGDAFLIRAQVHEAWDAVKVRITPATPVARIKAAALAVLLQGTAEPDDYVAKVRGAEVHDEGRPASESGLRAGSTVFVHARRRRPVR